MEPKSFLQQRQKKQEKKCVYYSATVRYFSETMVEKTYRLSLWLPNFIQTCPSRDKRCSAWCSVRTRRHLSIAKYVNDVLNTIHLQNHSAAKIQLTTLSICVWCSKYTQYKYNWLVFLFMSSTYNTCMNPRSWRTEWQWCPTKDPISNYSFLSLIYSLSRNPQQKAVSVHLRMCEKGCVLTGLGPAERITGTSHLTTSAFLCFFPCVLSLFLPHVLIAICLCVCVDMDAAWSNSVHGAGTAGSKLQMAA